MFDLSLLGATLASFVAACFFIFFLHIKYSTSKFAKASTSSKLFQKNSVDEEDAVDVIVVGAGVAGSALACTLAKDGRRVRVFERDLSEPDRIVGELLQPGGYLKLLELGLQDCVQGIDAQNIVGYALYKDGKPTKLSYPLENYDDDVAGTSFHNGRFVQKMRQKAASLPNVKLEQGTVVSLIEEKGSVRGVRYKTNTGHEFTAYAPLTVVCDGCFSNLRRRLCKTNVKVHSHFVGLILENCEIPFANHGHVILADPSPILFYPISSTKVRCLVDVPGEKDPSPIFFFLFADCVQGIDAQNIVGYALYKDGKVTKLSYPLENYNIDVAGRSFHNGRFVQKMRQKAASLPK